jgi:hypothetical protein
VHIAGRDAVLHVVRDLTALPEIDPGGRYTSKAALLARLSASLFVESDELFVLAANDGQLIETWRKASTNPQMQRALALFEGRLVGDTVSESPERLAFFNLSRISSATVFDLASEALLNHEGWKACYEEAEADAFFGDHCPIRRNYELLKSDLVRARLRALFQLCDYNELHTPIRRVLMLLTNSILGHRRAKDGLMMSRDVRQLIADGSRFQASLYSNVFGGNLSATKREALEIFDYLGRFGIGQETTNRIDNILIFGAEDENLRGYNDMLIDGDTFYGGTDRYRAAQRSYVEMPEGTDNDRSEFLDMLVDQRRGLFFKIPEEMADELKLWSLTVFVGAGEYLEEIATPLLLNRSVARRIIGRLVNGLNRIFTGLLVTSDRELLLATSLSYSAARLSQLLEDRIAVSARGRAERIDVSLRDGFPSLDVYLPDGSVRSLRLNLTRYEFLMRVNDGALPGNFSRECHEDILAFKSTLLAVNQHKSEERTTARMSEDLTFRLLSLDAAGHPIDNVIEVSHD